MLTLHLPPELEERLTDIARKTRRLEAVIAEEAISAYLEALEDFYLARQALEEGDQPMLLEDIVKKFGLDR